MSNDRSVARSLSDIVKDLFSRPTQWKVRLAKEWGTIMGPLAQHVRLERVTKDDTVILGVYDVHWMQELYLLSRTIAKTINTYLGDDYVQKINFKLVMRPQKNADGSPVKPIQKEVNVRALTLREKKALESINDDMLKKALQAFLERSIRITAREK